MRDDIDTVEGHLRAGAVEARERTTVDDLELAATWLEQYEGSVEDDAQNLTSLATVAYYLRRQAARRERGRKGAQ